MQSNNSYVGLGFENDVLQHPSDSRNFPGFFQAQETFFQLSVAGSDDLGGLPYQPEGALRVGTKCNYCQRTGLCVRCSETEGESVFSFLVLGENYQHMKSDKKWTTREFLMLLALRKAGGIEYATSLEHSFASCWEGENGSTKEPGVVFKELIVPNDMHGQGSFTSMHNVIRSLARGSGFWEKSLTLLAILSMLWSKGKPITIVKENLNPGIESPTLDGTDKVRICKCLLDENTGSNPPHECCRSTLVGKGIGTNLKISKSRWREAFRALRPKENTREGDRTTNHKALEDAKFMYKVLQSLDDLETHSRVEPTLESMYELCRFYCFTSSHNLAIQENDDPFIDFLN